MAIERGPAAHRHEGYPRSIFAMYDAISAGLGITDDGAVYVGGATALVGDIRNIIMQGLIGGASGLVDGDEIEVGPQTAGELVTANVYPARPLIEGMHIAWAILNAAINGVVLKKKQSAESEVETPNPSEKDR
ncbi:hypothetical protein WG907_04360 [Sphingobium sp. AN558]|uniref:hypothetical protein n=1 Tax=Sphingobium sp. AN558 TaxID=3133442 RepID=UPI0030BD538C